MPPLGYDVICGWPLSKIFLIKYIDAEKVSNLGTTPGWGVGRGLSLFTLREFHSKANKQFPPRRDYFFDISKSTSIRHYTKNWKPLPKNSWNFRTSQFLSQLASFSCIVVCKQKKSSPQIFPKINKFYREIGTLSTQKFP